MSASLTLPKANVPIGSVVIAGTRYDVAQSPEFVRLFFDLFRRVGSTAAPTNNDLNTLVDQLESATLNLHNDPSAQEAVRGVDELRNEISSLRSDCDNLRNQLAEANAEMAGLRYVAAEWRPRVEQLEDRLP